MNPLLKEIRRNPMLWLLVFVPVVRGVRAPSNARSGRESRLFDRTEMLRLADTLA
jgi:hypothetical protein